jgi:hypothetical protein
MAYSCFLCFSDQISYITLFILIYGSKDMIYARFAKRKENKQRDRLLRARSVPEAVGKLSSAQRRWAALKVLGQGPPAMLDLRKTKKKVRHRPQTGFEPEISQVRSKQFTTGLLVLMLKNMGRALLEADRSGARAMAGTCR